MPACYHGLLRLATRTPAALVLRARRRRAGRHQHRPKGYVMHGTAKGPGGRRHRSRQRWAGVLAAAPRQPAATGKSISMKHRTRLIILGLAALPLAGCGANSPATTAAAPFGYAGNTKSNEISQYSAPPRDFGALKPLALATVPTGPFPYGIAIEPHGNSVYVADVDANEVSQYTINHTTGQLTPKTPATVAAGRGFVEVAVTPNGESAYVVDRNASSQYSINPTTGS